MSSAPPVQRLEHWTLVTADLDRSFKFYTDVLGARVPDRQGGPTSVNFAGTIIDLFPARADWQPSPGSGGQHHAYVINLDDYDPWVEQLRKHDVPIQMRTHGLHRMSIYLDDPDGYHLELTVIFDSDEAGRPEIEKRGLTPNR